MSDTEKQAILKVLAWLATKDGDYSEGERVFIRDKTKQFGLFEVPTPAPNTSLDDLLRPIQSQEAQKTLLTCMLQLSFADGVYDARERLAIIAVAQKLGLGQSAVEDAEGHLVEDLNKALDQVKAQKPPKKEDSGWDNFGKIAGTALLGGVALALTGGLAAPLIGGAIGTSLLGLSGAAATSAGLALLGGGSLAAGGLGMAGGTAVVCAALGVGGAGLAGWKAAHLHGEMEEWDMQSVGGRGLNIQIGIAGWLNQDMSHPAMWKDLATTFPQRSNSALVWESPKLLDLGQSLASLGTKGIATQGVVTAALRATSKAAGLAVLPVTVLSALEMIDNPWAVAKNRAEQAGQLLGDYIADGQFGGLPVTLIGYSLGAKVILAALERLHERKETGKIYDVYFLAGAVSRDEPRLKYLKTMVTGKVVNVYSMEDLVLGLVYRSVEWLDSPIGIAPLSLSNVININVTKKVGDHLEYPAHFKYIFEKIRSTLEEESTASSPREQQDPAPKPTYSPDSQGQDPNPKATTKTVDPPPAPSAPAPGASAENLNKFRKLVAACYLDIPSEKDLAALEKFRQKYGVSPAEAESIIAEFTLEELIDPHEVYADRYRSLLSNDHVIDFGEQSELLDLQEELNLSDQEVDAIETKVKQELGL